jgi:phospholipid-binding lipoprotein MlaA
MPDPRNCVAVHVSSALLALSLLGGCASTSSSGNPQDPYESVNRSIYRFNEQVDKAVLKPVAQAYRFALPTPVRTGVSNFFSNINDVIVTLNNLLQGKFTTATSDFGRIVVNSTVGLLGLIDVASDAGLPKHDEDFGQTLGWYGTPNGPFIMLPFLGPSTGRDVVGRVGDYFSDPVKYVDPFGTRTALWTTRIVNRRAELLDASTILQTAALDPYAFVRDAYLQRRRNLIYDGAPPLENDLLEPEPAPAISKPRSERAPRGAVAQSADTPVPGSILVTGEMPQATAATTEAKPTKAPVTVASTVSMLGASESPIQKAPAPAAAPVAFATDAPAALAAVPSEMMVQPPETSTPLIVPEPAGSTNELAVAVPQRNAISAPSPLARLWQWLLGVGGSRAGS